MELEALGFALGLTADQSRLGLSKVPEDIIERNSFRRSREYVEEGVRLVAPRMR
jgi:RNase P/RNase MRP subunit p30